MKPSPIRRILHLMLLASFLLGVSSSWAVVQQSPVETLPKLSLWKNTQQKKMSLSKSDGKVRVINFWATWCAPCIRELPTLVGLAELYADQPLEVMLINQDIADPEKGEKFLEDKGWNTHVVRYYDDKGELMRAMGVKGLPATFIVDHQGDVQFYEVGIRDWQDQETQDRLNNLLARIPAQKTGFFWQWWPW